MRQNRSDLYRKNEQNRYICVKLIKHNLLHILVQTGRYLILVLTALSLSACVTMRNCPIETLQPAKLAFPGEKRSIAVCASPTLLSDAIMSNESTSGVAADSLIMNILYSLQKFWKSAPGFEESNFSVFLTKDVDASAFSGYDLVARLDRLQVKNSFYGEQYSYYEWEAYMHVHYVAEWSVRDRSGKLLDDYVDRDLIVWPSGIRSGKSEAVLNLPSVDDAWWDMGIAMAQTYAERIVPQWERGLRSIYMINKFPDLSEQAYTSMQNDGYERAFNIWEEMLLSCRKKGQKKIKSQIACNMAVAFEFRNQLDQALYWIRRSLNYSQNSFTKSYLNLLEERQKNSLQLDQQINR